MSPPRLVLLSKPGCHLCHVMKEVVERVLASHGGTLVEKDVREDPELERLYRLEIPVLMADGREIARHRITEAELRERLSLDDNDNGNDATETQRTHRERRLK